MSQWNIASFSKEEQDKVAVDKVAAAVAWQERMNKPVMPELVEREQPEHLREYFHERLRVHRLNSQQLPRANANIINPEMSSRSDSYRQCVQGGNFMRMSLMFAAVTLLTGINLFFIPFQPVPALWGAILAIAFVLINVVADKLRLWSGIAWIIVAGIIITLMLKGKEPGDELRVLITVFAFLASAWYCVVQYRKEQGESQF